MPHSMTMNVIICLLLGIAHEHCNKMAELKKEFPIFIHNFGSYDSHFLVHAMGDLKTKDVIKTCSVIPKTSEKFLSIVINGNIKFLDSLCFTLSSLDRLVYTMKLGGTNEFKITRQEFANEAANGTDIELLFKKGAYHYSLMKTLNDFKRDKLPDASDFYNNLCEQAIKDEVYEHALKVWNSFKIKNMGDWHDLYVRLDTALLADVIENTRKLMMESYGLELGHYLSLPMIAWDALLKMTKAELDHISDPTMHCWIEEAIRDL
jgi:hypothetical protein